MPKSQVLKVTTFGDFFRSKRIKRGLALRVFCKRYGYDPGNISRLERNILPPSLDDDKLAGYATALKIKRNSEEWVKFHDLAHTAKGKIPKDLEDEKCISELLPAFFRTMRNKKLDRRKLEKLIKLLNE
jgi:transcriptional regulator with XRE-family HTH domain